MWNWFGCFNGLGTGGGYIMMFTGTILIGLIIYLIFKTQNQNNGYQSTSSSSSAIEIAKARYARGEITHEELESIKKNLL